MQFLNLLTKRGGTTKKKVVCREEVFWDVMLFGTVSRVNVSLFFPSKSFMHLLIYCILIAYKGLSVSLTLDGDLAEGAGVARRTCGKAHVLARIVCSHVVQNQRAGAVGVLDDDMMRVCLHRTSIYRKSCDALRLRRK